MNKLTAEHTIDVDDLWSSVNQPMADVTDTPDQAEGWLTRLTERNYQAWLRRGGHSYGL